MGQRTFGATVILEFKVPFIADCLRFRFQVYVVFRLKRLDADCVLFGVMRAAEPHQVAIPASSCASTLHMGRIRWDFATH
jgi:hypothetical protein